MSEKSLVPTPGVTFPDKFRSPVSLIEVPVGTEVGAEVVVLQEFNGKTYGPYRVAAVLTPGEHATKTYAMAYRATGATKKALTKDDLIAENAKLIADAAKQREEFEARMAALEAKLSK